MISKAGFITPFVRQGLLDLGISVDKIAYAANADSNAVGHSLEPEVLQVLLTESLHRLNTSYLDIYMLNCPERMLALGVSHEILLCMKFISIACFFSFLSYQYDSLEI